MKLISSSLVITACSILWLAVVCAGSMAVLRYESTPGASADPSKLWPGGSGIQRRPGIANLVMIAHPHCPCTRTSIGELEVLMAQVQGQLAAHVVFHKPAVTPEDWEKSDLWDKAAAIPGVSVSWDNKGQAASRFAAETSGQVVVYDAQGRLIFSGGITGARGHSGDNTGRDAIVSLLTIGSAVQARTPVFGCSLLDATSPGSE